MPPAGGVATAALSVAALLTALVHIRAEHTGPRWRVYVCKPLTTGLILLLALQMDGPVSSFYRNAVAAGLVFSLAGDVFLMLPQNRFAFGLGSFLVGHFFYIAAFTSVQGFQVSLVCLAPFLLGAAVVYAMLLPHLGKLWLPVLVYVLAILVMAWQAAERWERVQDVSSLLAVAGALFFVVSDSALAFNRFRAPFRSAQGLVLGTYYTAQWLIALSVSA